MSHQDATQGVLDARSPVLDNETVTSSARPASDTDSELAELRRNLLLYGTAGQAARAGMEVKAF